jgi:signal transduction histidine kinase
MDLDPEHPFVRGDAKDLATMFFFILENSLEALDIQDPYIKISSRVKRPDSDFMNIEIFNRGVVPNPKDMENLFVPFYSSKPDGTGFGLPIAQLAARKSLGDIFLEPVPKKGTRCVIRLPVPQKDGGVV